MAKILDIVLNVIVLLTLLNEAVAYRCTRIENLKSDKRVRGDGGYRILIDGEPKGYQPGKTYNGKSFGIHSTSNKLNLLKKLKRPFFGQKQYFWLHHVTMANILRNLLISVSTRAEHLTRIEPKLGFQI